MTVNIKPSSSSPKLNRSCAKCRKSKLKCSGGSPCERCKKLSFDCVYLACKTRSKPNITKPKFYRLQCKEKRLNSVFGKVDEHFQLTETYKKFNTSAFESNEEDKGGVFEFLITRNLKELYYSKYYNNFNNIEKFDYSDSLVVGHTIKNAKTQFFKLLLELYETSSCYLFSFKVYERMLSSNENWTDSALANAIFAMSLRIYQAHNEEPPNAPNPFYERARYLFSQINDVNTVECAQTLLIFSYIEIGIGLFSKSAYSVNQTQRIALALGLDKICYEMDKNFTTENIESALIWLCCVTIDLMQTCDTDLPLFVHEDNIELSLALPNIGIDDFLSKSREFQFYIQMKLSYLLSAALSRLKKLSRKVENPKYDYCQVDFYNDLIELYERLEYYEASGWFYPQGYTLQISDYQDKQVLFTQFHRTMMLKMSFISVCDSIQRIRSNNLNLFATTSGFDNPFTCLYKYQERIQQSIVDVISFFYRLKCNPTPGFNVIDRLLYISTPTSAFALTGACEYLTRDLSPFGRSCFEFCYLEAQKQAKVWCMIRSWVHILEKHYQKNFTVSKNLSPDTE